MEPQEVLLQGSAETVDVTLLLTLGGDELRNEPGPLFVEGL